ncbi:MAG: HypC/HybG/HupF family hydrogenase formation chaperone [Gemmatimonadota bacterium]
MSSFHCVTCSDEGVPMRVAALHDDPELAVCVDEEGARAEVMTALVEDVRVGDRLLVHAGTALLRLEADRETHVRREASA